MKIKNTFKETDCGGLGKATEKAVKAYFGKRAFVSSANLPDFELDGVQYEIKTGSGVIKEANGKTLPHCDKVIYIPRVNENKPFENQFGIVMARGTFLAMLKECGLIRDKVSTDGIKCKSIQTFWNRSKNAPHGNKYWVLEEAMLTRIANPRCKAQSLQEWLACNK